MKAINKKSNIDLYLEWVNDWLTLKAMAGHYHCSVNTLYKKLIQGKSEHENSAKK